MKLYGTVWNGMEWYGMEWHGMAWCGVVWCGLVWNDTEVYGMVRHGTLRYLVVWLWRGAARHGLGDSVAWHPTAWSGEPGAGSGEQGAGTGKQGGWAWACWCLMALASCLVTHEWGSWHVSPGSRPLAPRS